ncbi:hypothetical protein [Actinoplanes sp. NPDC051494]|uniref:hypothetical protein n=1 Tax=Actinoplanes sp. NPDC051494 TaxID=3363907 RepID=UPI0037BB79DC
MADSPSKVVPVDLTQDWPTGRHVSGANEDLIGFKAPTSNGNGGWTNSDGKPVDEHGNLLPDASAPTGDPAAPDLRSYKVSPGEMHDAETTILAAMKGQITDFESFRDSAISRSSWVFYTGKESDTVSHYHQGVPLNPNVKWSGAYDDGSGWYAAVKDPHPDQTAEIQYNQYQLLQGVGGVMQLVGDFVGKLNNAAQIYAGADIHSTVPDGTTTA